MFLACLFVMGHKGWGLYICLEGPERPIYCYAASGGCGQADGLGIWL